MPDPPARPLNVVLITAHDLGQYLGCYGIETVNTPHLDQLAADGVQFANARGTTPVCSPSRGSLLTGRYPQSNGLMGLTHSPWWWRLDDREQTLPELLRQRGYATHLAGLQHVAEGPDRLGFENVYAPDREPERITAAAQQVFASAGQRPFFAQFGFSEVHRAFTHGEDDSEGVWIPPYLVETEELRTDLAAFQGEIRSLDEYVGTILESLATNDLREETIVVFAADHGIPYPGAKGWCRSPGVEIALLMDGPGSAFDQVDPVQPLCSNVDVLPTLFPALQTPIPDQVQGVSQLPYLRGDTDEPPRTAAFSQHSSAARGIATEAYNLVRNFSAGREIEYPVEAPPTSRGPSPGPGAPPRPFAQLFDREADPYELHDRATEEPAVVAELSEQLLGWMDRVGDPLLRGPVAEPYYERAIRDLLIGEGTARAR